MKSLNRVSLIGTVGRDPEVSHTPSGTTLAKFSLALDEKYKDRSGEWVEKTEWANVILWSKLAEIAGEYVKKGGRVFIEGRLSTSSWEKDGVKHSKTEVVGSEIILLDGKSGSGKSAPKKQEPIDDSDIPF
jgi:single-strand DNA-binding protein